ncbi:TauD/TfdA family dioxygenase [Diaphorobacter sp.]|uniref:TauD/TfdA dioxygenase family protein n=1 Tax=Diaphorobacter sp. TaxID=1934310 RepID=UPI0028AFA4A9|nr:TauD/TfdA family dioxygenase [Diaphorobacter sp.]
MSISYSSLAPGFGLRIDGLDISQPLTQEQSQAMRDAWSRANGVLLFRNQNLSPEQHVAFTAHFGDVYRQGAANNKALAPYYLPGHPEIFRVSNKVIDGQPAGREDAGTYWHSDGSWQANPPLGSLLYAVEIPPVGGDTMFADMYRAYDNLSDTFKLMLEGLEAEHSLAAAVLRTSYAKEYAGRLDEAAAKKATHSIVKTHPQSGRKCLFVNPGFTSHIVGIPQDESSAILNFLYAHIVKAENVYRHRWQKNDLIMWDNRCNLNYAVADYKKEGVRYMHRTTVKQRAEV